jgi:hypothetical protein
VLVNIVTLGIQLIGRWVIFRLGVDLGAELG